ncbi:MAG: PRC-barrel domain containing protein [Lysobacterales bacterium]|nr:MAG: PRC-barrel domain containing protein [Xanthomonadales bacterium]
MNVSPLWRRQCKVAVVAAAIAVALGSSAQQAQEPVRENANRPDAGQSTQIARSDAGMQTLEQYLQGKTLRVSKLAGMELQSRTGDNFGEVEDVIRPATAGQDMQLVVQIGGVGVDEKLVAIPFDELQISADGDELYTSRTREQLAAAPAVQLDRRTTGNDAAPAQRSAADANRDAANRGAAPQPGAAGEPRTTQPASPGAGQRSTGATASTSLSQQRVADLVGAEVIGSGGDQVGEVDDIVISTAGADSIRAVLQVGGIAGIGEKRVAVPMSQVTVERSADGDPTLRVAMDLQSLERLPEFEYEEDTAAL